MRNYFHLMLSVCLSVAGVKWKQDPSSLCSLRSISCASSASVSVLQETVEVRKPQMPWNLCRLPLFPFSFPALLPTSKHSLMFLHLKRRSCLPAWYHWSQAGFQPLHFHLNLSCLVIWQRRLGGIFHLNTVVSHAIKTTPHGSSLHTPLFVHVR